MQTLNALPSRWSSQPLISLWLCGIALTFILWILLLRGQFHLLVAFMIGVTLLLISRHSRSTAALITIAYLLLMGDLRRILSLFALQPNFDPLLLVGPTVAFVLAVPVLARIRLRDALSKVMFAIMCMMVLEVLNPRQGGLGVGVTGAFFYVIPMLWFWVGRSLESHQTIERLMYRIILPLGIMAATLGLCQTFIGLLPYQKAWASAATRVYTSLYVGGYIRPFGFSVSAAEYSALLMLAFLTTISAFFTRKRMWCVFLPVIGASLILASGRSVVVRSLLAFAALLVVRKQRPLKPSTVVTGGVLAALLLAGVSQLASRLLPPSTQPSAQKSSAAQGSLAHQFGGLAHPFDERYSTAGLHANMMVTGVVAGFKYPMGSGIGYSTFAAEKLHGGAYDNEGQGSSEIDFADMFIDLGFIGGLLYLAAVGLILYDALRYVRIVPLHVGLPVFAILLATTGGWLIAGQYSTSSLLLFTIGVVTRAVNHAALSSKAASFEPSTLVESGAPRGRAPQLSLHARPSP